MSFISLTGHYLDADFKQQHFCLSGQHFPGTHTGVEIGGILRSVIDEFEITKDQYGILLRDGASNYTVGARVRKFFSYFVNLSYSVLYHLSCHGIMMDDMMVVLYFVWSLLYFCCRRAARPSI